MSDVGRVKSNFDKYGILAFYELNTRLVTTVLK